MNVPKPLLLFLACVLLISFQSPKQAYLFHITANQVSGTRPESITVEITNNETTVLTLRNLLFDFFIGDDSFYAIPESSRFVDTFLTIKPKARFTKTIAIDSMLFVGNENNIFGANYFPKPAELREKFLKSKSVKFRATMEDLTHSTKPTVEVFLIRSNVIEIPSKQNQKGL